MKKSGPGILEAKSFKGVNGRQMDGLTDGRIDGQRSGSEHNSSSCAFGSGELKSRNGWWNESGE